MLYFNQIYRLMWFVLIILIMFLSFQDRTIELDNGSRKIVSAFSSAPYLSIFIIILLLFLTTVSILRALESRNQWRKIAKEDNINKKISDLEKTKK